MKKIFYGAIVAFTLIACGGEESKTEELSEEVKQEVVEIENATEEVEAGTIDMTEKVDDLSEDIDELLNDI